MRAVKCADREAEKEGLAMAQYAASPPCIKLHMWRSCVKESGYVSVPQISHFRSPQRKCSRGSYEFVRQASPCLRATSLRCSCLGSLVDPDVATLSDWVTVTNQLLLTASVFLTYMAGAVPLHNSNFIPRKNKDVFDEKVNAGQEISTSTGSARKNDDHVEVKHAWDVVKAKLLDSIDAIERRSNLGNRILEFEKQHPKPPISLYAVSEGPKLRLLWASFLQLQEQVNNVLGDCEAVDMDKWLAVFPEIIQKSCHPVCMTWLVEELHLEGDKSYKELVSLMMERFKGDDTVLQNIRKSGKEDLYAELLYFLRFGSLRLFILHGDSILEDLVITLADGIAGVYLELISVDGNLSSEMNSLCMVMSNLSTRALQRLRNEVALNQWLYQNMEAVVSMYEDRFDLWTLQLKVIKEPSRNQIENHSWWRKLTLRKSETNSSSFCYTAISQFSMPVKRTRELRALTGWRYYFSLYLELSDITMPLIRAVIDKVSNAISFFLVSLIGRSLGLIYTGIRQSLRWK